MNISASVADPEALEALLAEWLPAQRWFPLKDASSISVQLDGARDLPGSVFTVHFVRVHAGLKHHASTSVTLLVPLGVAKVSPEGVPPSAVLGTIAGQGLVYDALFDLSFMDAWLSVMDGLVALPRIQVWSPGGPALQGPAQGVRVMTAEQSNTSVVFSRSGIPLIAKFFRVLHAGVHPEVEVGKALASANSTLVPKLMGAVTAALPGVMPGVLPNEVSAPVAGRAVTAAPASSTLMVLHSFIEGGQGGWETALEAAAAGKDFSAQARAIGEDLATIHGSLRQSLGESNCTGSQVRGFVEAIVARLTWAWNIAGNAVGDYESQLNDVIAQLRQLKRLPVLQRIHGDLHLGQLIQAPNSQWYFLDFEGEPLRPLAERGAPDVPLRDVVGMLRSFDYAGAQAAMSGAISPEQAAQWTAECSAAFCAGYQQLRPGTVDPASPLFAALLLDKALYEVVYELANRPAWLGVPVGAVRNLLDSRESGGHMAVKKGQALVVEQDVLASIAEGSHYAPHSVLGAHLDDHGSITVRTLRHLAEAVTLVTAEGSFPMTHEFGGVWVVVIPEEEPGHVPDYRLDVQYADGVQRVDDPYRYLPTVGELDLHLMAEGRHETLWTTLGAHVRRYHSSLGEVTGVSFAVWAPGVRAVRVMGEFNGWDGRAHAMRTLGTSGVWELFIPDVEVGARYKFQILTEHGGWIEKADPMAYGTEVPPLTASRVVESTYAFKDSAWMEARAAKDPHNSPMSVYEVHLGSWRLGLSYEDLATQLVDYVKWLGFTHVEFMPVAEHPFGGSWGYQVTSYYAPTSRFGHPDQFRYLVDALHQAGIGVIMDWVPAHFPKDEWALARFNGGPLYEHADPRLGEHPDWGTLIFDFGRNEVRNFLVANALYWLEEFHIDGLRVDAVASMLYLDYSREEGQWSPNRFGGRENLEAMSFLQEMNATAYRRNPGIVTIAEESTAFPGVTAPTDANGLGFGIKWNMGWMHDSLSYIEEDPVNRGWHHNQITFSLVYAFTENFLLPISHDEVVHGKGSLLRKMPGDRWQQLANLRAYLAFQWAHPGKQLIFMGTEFGQEAEWSEQHGLDWWLSDNPSHRGVQLLLKDLNALYSQTPALYQQDNTPDGFTWINGGDTDHNVVSFVRWDSNGDPLVFVVNFAGVAYEGFRVGLPAAGRWVEALNTDDVGYGGSGVTNPAALVTDPEPWDGQSHSVELRVPPLGAVYLRPEKA